MQFRRSAKSDAGERLLAEARRWLGYTSHMHGSQFSERAGYPGLMPYGTFWIDCIVADAGVSLPSFTSPAAVLAHPRTRRFDPQVGDGVVFQFSSPGGDLQSRPHVGIVSRVYPNGSFTCIEPDTALQPDNSASPCLSVSAVDRWLADTAGFISPIEPKLSPRAVDTPDSSILRQWRRWSGYLADRQSTKFDDQGRALSRWKATGGEL